MTSDSIGVDVKLEIDCRGLLCPLPAAETKKALRRIDAAEVVRVRCTDPAARIDLAALCARSGDDLLRVEERPSELVFWIRKRSPV